MPPDHEKTAPRQAAHAQPWRAQRQRFALSRPSASVLAMLVCAAAAATAQAERPSSMEIEAVMNEMAVRGQQFPSERLLSLGAAGLGALFDELLPETAAPAALSEMADTHRALIEQLGAEKYQAREAATRQLRSLGRAAYAALHEAAKSSDAEVAWRAVGVLRAWNQEVSLDPLRYLPALSRVLRQLDDPESLAVVAARTQKVLLAGRYRGGRRQLLIECVRCLARAKDPQYLAQLEPILDAADQEAGVLIVQGLSLAARNGACPPILIKAIGSPRVRVAAEAITACMQFDEQRAPPELQQTLRAVLKGADDRLKLLAARVLIQSCGDEDAIAYAVDQARHATDRARQYEAVNSLSYVRGDTDAPRAKVIEALSDLARADDANLRIVALTSLNTYPGDEAVTALVALMAEQKIRNEVGRRLLQRPDRDAVARLVQAAARENADPGVRESAERVLKELRR